MPQRGALRPMARAPGFAAVPGQGLLDFLRDAGSYRRVRTQKIDFLDLADFAYVAEKGLLVFPTFTVNSLQAYRLRVE